MLPPIVNRHDLRSYLYRLTRKLVDEGATPEQIVDFFIDTAEVALAEFAMGDGLQECLEEARALQLETNRPNNLPVRPTIQ